MTPQQILDSTARANRWSTTWSSSAPGRRAGGGDPAQAARRRGRREVSVVVLEKGSEPGAHILSGAVMDPRAMAELFPDWKERGAPLNQPVTGDDVLFLREAGSTRTPTGCCPSACTTTATTSSAWARSPSGWRAGRSAGRGDLPRLRRAEVLYDEARARCGRGHRQSGHRQGRRADRRLPARHGAAGQVHAVRRRRARPPGQAADRQVQARHRARPAELRHRHQGAVGGRSVQGQPGLVVHTAGWPMDDDTYGGGFLYHLEGNKVTLGFVVGLDYQNPWLSPFEEMQRWKTHPAIRAHIEGGKRIGYGARAITAGGLLSLPKLVFPGGALVGCDAGFLNASRIKGSHAAIKTGMLAPRPPSPPGRRPQPRRAGDYPEASSTAGCTRSCSSAAQLQAVVQEGQHRRHADDRHRAVAAAQAGHQEPALDAAPHKPDHAACSRRPRPADRLPQARRQAHLRPPVLGVHVQHQPRGKPARAPDAEGRRACRWRQPGAYAGPRARYCPAGVYEFVRTTTAADRLQINAQNCVHCKTCDIKDPTQNIVWVTPEGGGGPNYAGDVGAPSSTTSGSARACSRSATTTTRSRAARG
jgi:electron-transferring-flavoprotein dehydrogenase